MQRQRMTVAVTWDLVRWHLTGMYGKIQQGVDAEGVPTMRIMSTVDIKAVGKYELSIEWVGSVTNDMVADSVIALVLGVDGSPASVKSESLSHHTSASTDPRVPSETSSGHSHSHDHPHPHAEPESPSSDPDEVEDDDALALPNRLDRLLAFLSSYFGQVELINPEDTPIADVEPKEEAEEVEVKDEKMGVVEDGEEDIKVKIEHPRVPVIRVRLDEHVADVNVEDMVRSISRPRRRFH